jgi:23S rRNA (cytosine1962-C5)-methyltransferase
MLKLLTPQHWKDYELIDFEDGEMLERFGSLLLIRPEPQAVGIRKLSEAEWLRQADMRFEQKTSSSGIWKPLDRKSVV